jgi:hypothetical protein
MNYFGIGSKSLSLHGLLLEYSYNMSLLVVIEHVSFQIVYKS